MPSALTKREAVEVLEERIDTAELNLELTRRQAPRPPARVVAELRLHLTRLCDERDALVREVVAEEVADHLSRAKS